jgi:hypothetical protein
LLACEVRDLQGGVSTDANHYGFQNGFEWLHGVDSWKVNLPPRGSFVASAHLTDGTG